MIYYKHIIIIIIIDFRYQWSAVSPKKYIKTHEYECRKINSAQSIMDIIID